MAHVFQVGAGSGGMVALDLLARDERITRVTLVDPDIYQVHNVVRHYFAAEYAGEKKVDLAARWVRSLRPELTVDALALDLLDPRNQAIFDAAAADSVLGVCAVDVEPAKFHFDALMRKHGKRWTLGEVLSGGIGGWVHHFVPGGPCYGCVASHLQRTIQLEHPPAPDYSQPQAPVEAARIPATKTSITAIASLHASVTLDLLGGVEPGFSSMLVPLVRVEAVFNEAYKPYRFQINRLPECLICGMASTNLPTGEQLDVALDQALARLGDE